MMSLAASPGTDVEPMWSMRRARSPNSDRSADASALAGDSSQHDDWIRVALMQLSPDHRQVVELTYYGGFSYREIAQIAACPVNTVKTRMFHARRRLRVLLPSLAGRLKEHTRERA